MSGALHGAARIQRGPRFSIWQTALTAVRDQPAYNAGRASVSGKPP